MPRCTLLAVTCLLCLAQLACSADAVTTDPPKQAPPDTTPKTGSLVVKIDEHGNGRDADGVMVSLDGAPVRVLSEDAPLTFDSLAVGQHSLRLARPAPQCVSTTDSAFATVHALATDTVHIAMTCLGGIAYHAFIPPQEYDIKYLGEDGRTTTVVGGPGIKFISGWSPDGSRLAYRVLSGNYFSSYTVRLDGTDAHKISTALQNGGGSWSPDGSHVAFWETDYASRYTSWITMSDPAGSSQRVLVDKLAEDIDPVWSADGSHMFFACGRFTRSYDLCTAAIDGTGLQKLRYPELEALCAGGCSSSVTHPQASPDGRAVSFLVFEPAPNGMERVWIGKPDGSSAVAASGTTRSFDHRWSPKGDRLLLSLWDGGTSYTLGTVDRDGKNFRQLGSFSDGDEQASWSPDGALIAFDNSKGDGQQIWVMNADGTSRYKITAGVPEKFAPLWNPKAHPFGVLTGGGSLHVDSRGASPSVARGGARDMSSDRSTACHPTYVGGRVGTICASTP